LGRQAEAEKNLRESIAVFKVKADTTDQELLYYQGKSKNWLGYIFFQQGRFQKAITMLEEAEQHFLKAESLIRADREIAAIRKKLRRHQINDWLAQVRGNLCRVYRERGEFAKALVNGESSLAKRRQLGNKKEILKGLNTLGLVYERQGDLQQAYQCYLEAEELLRIVPDPILEGRILTNKATVLFKREQFSSLLVRHTRNALPAAKAAVATDEAARIQARALLTHVTSLLLTGNSRELAIAYNNLGELDLLEDKYEAAIVNFKNAVKVSQLGRDTYTLLNSMQRLALAAYLKNDAPQFDKFATAFVKTRKSLKNREETARYMMRFDLTMGNVHYDKLRHAKSKNFNEHFKQAFQAYTEAIVLAREFAYESQKLTQEVFAERMLELVKVKKEVSPALQNQLKTLWENKNLDLSELERYFTF
jgi:tetratricopeptide (TPR) repeat protein